MAQWMIDHDESVKAALEDPHNYAKALYLCDEKVCVSPHFRCLPLCPTPLFVFVVILIASVCSVSVRSGSVSARSGSVSARINLTHPNMLDYPTFKQNPQSFRKVSPEEYLKAIRGKEKEWISELAQVRLKAIEVNVQCPSPLCVIVHSSRMSLHVCIHPPDIVIIVLL